MTGSAQVAFVIPALIKGSLAKDLDFRFYHYSVFSAILYIPLGPFSEILATLNFCLISMPLMQPEIQGSKGSYFFWGHPRPYWELFLCFTGHFSPLQVKRVAHWRSVSIVFSPIHLHISKVCKGLQEMSEDPDSKIPITQSYDRRR